VNATNRTPPPVLDVMVLSQAAFQHARAGEATRLDWLIGLGLPVNLATERGDSLLMLASYHGREEATRVLLRHRADTERTNDRQQTALAGVVFRGHLNIARMLLEHGARVDGVDSNGRTALMISAMLDRVDMLELLLQGGAAMARRDAAGRTALDYARSMGAQGTVQRLSVLRAKN